MANSMYSIGKAAPWVAAAVLLTSERTSACCVQVHYTKAQVEAADIRLYERDVKTRGQNVTIFDQKHPLLGQVLGSEQVYEQELSDWKKHPGLFELEHPYLTRVLEGDKLYHEKHPYAPAIEPTASYEPGSPENSVPTQPGGGNPDDNLHGASVPEPGSGVLMLVAALAGLIATGHRARSKAQNELGNPGC
jgi:hypothetical protein